MKFATGVAALLVSASACSQKAPAPSASPIVATRRLPSPADYRNGLSEADRRQMYHLSEGSEMNIPFPSAMTVTRVSVSALLVVPLAAQSADRLTGKNVSIAQTNYKGRNAIQVVATPEAPNAASYAVVKDVLFRDGTIEVDLAGQPAAGAGGGARGFIGIAFRLQGDGSYEYIYLRPTNGRADDQIRRNHSTQYSSHPNFDFARSRQEAPEKYESYVDLQPGVWTKYKIEVEGRKARLYVHGAEQPCLIVDDLKLEPREGGVALWVGPGTEGYFSNLKIAAK